MNKLFIVAIVLVLTFGSVGFALAAPYYVVTRTIVPESDSAFDVGTSTLAYRNLYVDRICLNTDCQTAWPTGGSGTFSWTPQSWGNSTSTTLGFLNGFISTASSTITNALRLSSLSQGGLYSGVGGLVGTFATTSVTCSGNTTCTAFTALGSSPITISSTGGGTGLSTTSPISGSNVLVYSSTGAGAAYGAATSSLTASGVLSLSQPISVLGSSASALTLTGGSAGQVLGWLGGIPTWTASSSVAAGTGISVAAAGAVSTVTNSSPLSGLSAGYPFSFSNPTLTWLGLSTTTNSGMSAGNLYVGSGGILQTSASSSIFGYIPLDPTRSLTVSSGNGTIVSSAGAQNLSADRTWTLTYTGLATTSQPASSNLLVSNGGAGLYPIATTSATCSTGISCAAHTVLGGGGAITLSALGSAGVLGAITATTPTVQATSTLYGASTGGMVLGWSNTLNGIGWIATSTAGGGSGTVTSVDMTVPTGLSISGNPITTSGTLALSLAAGYNIPLTASTTNWNTFYDTPSNRITGGTGLTWSGNTLNIATSSLYSGTTGQFPYFSGTNTITATSSLFLATSGNVGIGTTTPGSILSVAGVGNFAPTGSTLYSTLTAPYFIATSTTATSTFQGILAGDTTSGLFFDTASGRLSLGSKDNTHTISGLTYGEKMAVHIEGATDAAGVSMHRHSDTVGFGAHLLFSRSRGTEAVESAVTNGDFLGRLDFLGHDGTDYEVGAQIDAIADGVIGSNDMPTKLAFWTTPDGSATPLERLTIKNSGNVGVGTTTPGSLLQLFSTGTTTLSIDSNSASKGGCVEIKDMDGTGYTYLYANNGQVFTSQTSCK